jgi:O-antigen/teichoic acid export membrane protein
MNDETKTNSLRDLAETVAIYIFSFALTYVSNILMSRWLGAESFGDYSVTLSVSLIGSTLAILGFDKATLRFLPVYDERREDGLMRGYVRAGARILLASSLALSALGAAAYFGLRHWRDLEDHPVLFATILVPLITLVDFLSKVLIGYRRQRVSILLAKIQQPALVVLVALAFFLVHGGLPIHLAVAAVVISWLSLLVIYFFVYRHADRGRGDVQPVYRQREWIRATLPYCLTGLVMVSIHHAGIIVIELLHASEAEVGLYAASLSTVSGMFILLAAVSVLAVPRFSILIDADDKAMLQAEVCRFQRFLLAGCSVYAIGLVLFGRTVLSWFGDAFVDGYEALLVLTFGFFVNVMLGLCRPLLQLVEEHRRVIASAVVLFGLNVALNAALVPEHGVLGAAWGFTIPIVLATGYQFLLVRRRRGILVLPFA